MLAQTRGCIHAARCARVVQEFSAPKQDEGVGNAGRPMHPQSRVQNKKAHEVVTVGSPDQPGIPARNGFNGFLRDLPGDRAWLSPSSAVCLRTLDASVEASGPHDFAVRLGAVRQRHLHVHRIPPRVRDDRDTPLWWDETGGTTVGICAGRKPKYFSKWGWTGKSLICASSQIAVLSVGSANNQEPFATVWPA